MTLTCSSAEFLCYGDQLIRAGIRAVTLTDYPAVFVRQGETASLGKPRGPKVPYTGDDRAAVAALLAAGWPTVNFQMPEKS